MSDILLAEIIRLVSIVLSISIVNFVVGYRKNCDIDKWKNIAIQSVIVVIIFIISKYIDVMNLSIIYNEKTNYIEKTTGHWYHITTPVVIFYSSYNSIANREANSLATPKSYNI